MEPIYAIPAAIALLVIFVQTARASYHSGRADVLDDALEHERKNDSGWEDEARFWRNAVFSEAETQRPENK